MSIFRRNIGRGRGVWVSLASQQRQERRIRLRHEERRRKEIMNVKITPVASEKAHIKFCDGIWESIIALPHADGGVVNHYGYGATPSDALENMNTHIALFAGGMPF